MRRPLAILMAAVILFSIYPAKAGEQPAPTLRALLVACDDFISQPDTAPSSYNNVIALRRALLYDTRGYSRIRVSLNEALDKDSFAQLAASAFAGAGDLDISLFYLSTHGLQSADKTDFIALMSDGEQESHLHIRDIYEGLKIIPGVKVIILDACFSGAAINKGMDIPLVRSIFTGPDFKVLTSAGAQEPSFLWTDGAGTVQGGSFFSHALTEGISAEGRYAADSNQDGLITLQELYTHQLLAYGASTPQVYPQQDDFVVFAYRTPYAVPRSRLVTRLLLESAIIREAGEPIQFSYTLNQDARLAYQLVYMDQGEWQFQNPQSIADMGRGDGIVLPGRKEISFEIAEGMQDLSGYLLLLLITVFEDRSRPLACVLTSVQTQQNDPQLRVDSAPGFTPGTGEEAAFVLRHTGAVEYTARVLNEEGKTVSYLQLNQMSRPLHLQDEGSTLFWDGKTSAGAQAPAGKYRLQATAYAGGQKYETFGDWFDLY